ncbi:MAG: PAS domain-containing protein [Actinobacteria bacterium]|nr:PAS domain-containing protein [Actinomycetota bacterium]
MEKEKRLEEITETFSRIAGSDYPYSNRKTGRDYDIDTVIEEISKLPESALVLIAELVGSEELFRSVAETSTSGIAVSDMKGNLLYVSPYIMDIFGYESAGEVLGKSVFGFAAPEDRERAIISFRRVLELGVMRNVELTLIRKNSTRFIGGVSGSIQKDKDGAPKTLTLFVDDISRRKREEWKLKNDEGRLRGIVGACRDAIVLINRESKITFWNPAAETLFLYTDNEMLGHNMEILFPEANRKAYSEEFRKYFEGLAVPEENLSEFELSRKDDTLISVEMSLSSIYLGDQWNLICFIRDVAGRKIKNSISEDSRESHLREEQ